MFKSPSSSAASASGESIDRATANSKIRLSTSSKLTHCANCTIVLCSTLAEEPLAYAGSSGAIMQTGQRIGISIGIAVITAIVFAVRPHSSWAVAVSVGLLSIALIMLLALMVAIKDLRDRRDIDPSVKI